MNAAVHINMLRPRLAVVVPCNEDAPAGMNCRGAIAASRAETMPKKDSKAKAPSKTHPQLVDELQGFAYRWREASHLAPGDKRALELAHVFEAIQTAYIDADYGDLTPEQNAKGRARNASFLNSMVASARHYLQERGYGRRGRARDADFLEDCTRRDIEEGLDDKERTRRFFQILRATPSICSETRVPHRDAPYDAEQNTRDIEAVRITFAKRKARVDTESVVKAALRALGQDETKNKNVFAHRNRKR